MGLDPVFRFWSDLDLISVDSDGVILEDGPHECQILLIGRRFDDLIALVVAVGPA
jgi:hypothetical protein